jgi:hypothetical protein
MRSTFTLPRRVCVCVCVYMIHVYVHIYMIHIYIYATCERAMCVGVLCEWYGGSHIRSRMHTKRSLGPRVSLIFVHA